MSLDLSHKTFLITGATGSLGREIAHQAAAAGASLILHGRRTEALAALDDELHAQFNVKTLLWPLDFLTTSQAVLSPTVDELCQHFSSLDAVFNCATYCGQQTPILQEPHETWIKVMQVNVESPRLIIKEILSLLKLPESANIVFFIDEINDTPYQGAFGISKQLIVHLVEQLNLEFENINNVKSHALKVPPLYSPLRAKRFPGEEPGSNVLPRDAVATILQRLYQQ